jgi:hypothetical protein
MGCSGDQQSPTKHGPPRPIEGVRAGRLRNRSRHQKDLKTFLDLSQVAVNLTGVVILGFTIWNIRFATSSFRKQMNAQVYLAYTDRYERLMADCPIDFRTTLLELPLNEVDPKDRDRIKLCLLRYLNLCSEEFHLIEDRLPGP